MSDFKKFIDTKGKTIEEIKKAVKEVLDSSTDRLQKNVREMISNTIEAAERNTGFEIKKLIAASNLDKPKSGAEKYNREKEYKPERIPPAQRDNSGFAPKSSVSYARQTSYPHEAMSEDITEKDLAMLNMIKQMRELELYARGGSVVKRAVEITMVEQGSFMSEVEDDFPRRVFCALPQPIYAQMSNSQLRTFFTWRTDARRGIFTPVDKPYVLLYCYELLNKIGVKSSVEAFDKLLEAREGCRSFAPYLKPLMERWLKDFCAFNDVSEKYPDITAVLQTDGESLRERGTYDDLSDIDAGNYAGKADFLAKYSTYDIKKSIFYSEETAPLFDGACEYALRALDEYFKQRGQELSELICGRLKKDYAWSPFKDAIVNLDTADGFRPVRISASERYCLKRGEPTLELFDFSPMCGFIGYVLKSVEAELRLRTGFNRRLSPKLTMLQNDIKNRSKLIEAVNAPEFERVIPKAVAEYCAKNGIKPPVKSKKSAFEEGVHQYAAAKVEIDVSKLDEIREKADETAQKLLSEDEEYPSELGAIAEQILDDEFSARIDEYREELSPRNEKELPPMENAAFDALPEEWACFARSLTSRHIAVLKALREGSVREYCREQSILPETAFEEINTEALSAVGDVVIEHGELVPDYSEDIKRLLELYDNSI